MVSRFRAWRIKSSPLAVTLASVLCLALAEHAAATFPGENGRIAIADTALWIAEPDGSVFSEVADWRTNVYNTAPSVSADGERIAWTRGSLGASWQRHIYVANADGTQPRQVTTDGDNNNSPAFSPDGTIAFDRNTDFEFDSDIYTINEDGSGLTQLTSGPAADTEPAFSPDGEWIAFVRNGSGPAGHSLQLMSADGSQVTELVGNRGWIFAPSFSPDGERIAFTSEERRGGRYEPGVNLIDVDGSDEVKLPLPEGVDGEYAPVFSPDGERLLVVSEDEHSCDKWECFYTYRLFTQDIDGSDRTPITPRGFGMGEPFWESPIDWGVQTGQEDPSAICDGAQADIVGTDRVDRIFGTSKRDVIAGLGGDDEAQGNRGADLVCGGDGKDQIAGGRGPDTLRGGAASDRCLGGPGADRMRCEDKAR